MPTGSNRQNDESCSHRFVGSHCFAKLFDKPWQDNPDVSGLHPGKCGRAKQGEVHESSGSARRSALIHRDFTATLDQGMGILRQASLKEVRERTDKTLRPDWINLPGEQ
jgi:hypothetical protein